MKNLKLMPVMFLLAASCAETGGDPASGPDGELVEINYRGKRMFAERQGGLLLIEGDIAVGPADLWSEDGEPGEIGEDGTEIRRGALTRITGVGFKWPNGAVRYSLVNVAAADQPTVRNGIAMWQRTPGLSFTELTGACTGDCINFNTSTVNNSPAGRQGGVQTINLQASPGLGTVAHELSHALGIWHEQSRSDRGTFVRINWAQIQGCTNAATSIANCGATACQAGAGTPGQNAVNNGCCTLTQFNAGQCYRAFNFDPASSSPQALMYTYDYDSLMHYNATAFSKSGAATITPLQTLPPGVVMGQRNHLSTVDQDGMNALYPVLRTNGVLFRNTGTQTLARLEGREADINERFNCTIASVSTTTSTVNTALLSEGALTANCTAQSVLWTQTYSYPNFTNTSWPGSGIETFSVSSPVNVLNPGLIAVIANVI